MPLNSISLSQRLLRNFLLQGAVIGLAMIASVLVAGAVIKDVLVKQALVKEADYFWAARQSNPAFPLPDTLNLSGFLIGDSDETISPSIASLPPGFHELTSNDNSSAASPDNFSVAHVSEQNGQKLILGFAGKQVNQLTFYFGLLPLMVVLLVLYIMLWWAYRTSRRAVSPMIGLARQVSDLDPADAEPEIFALPENTKSIDKEVQVLSDALMRFTHRLNAFIDRERNFTRDASHELRSPLTVIKLAADMLLSEQELTTPAKKSVMRIRQAVEDMEEMTNAFLLLSRESDRGLTSESICLNDIVDEEIDRARLIIGDKPIAIRKKYSANLSVTTSDKALSIVIGNLLRNAFNYTDEGEVIITIDDKELKIADSGIGMRDPQQAFDPYFRGERRRGGYGVGLSIVKRFSDRFGWNVAINSEVGVGTEVTLSFPEPLAPII